MLSRPWRRAASALPWGARPAAPSGRSAGSGGAGSDAASAPAALDEALREVLVCPLSKKPLRYEMSTNELINEELGIAYPVVDGIPNMIPQAARMIRQNKQQEEKEHE
ncbi:protein preY, mitochondrial [Macrotis lagotis]|uniref:protein preY, mitochondrial n=1 Tax=Macrotis lagotis TaxID=92651 RepID=UPI003D68A85C